MSIERFLFGDPIYAFLKRSLDVQQFRTEVIASNLANVDTPGYQARDVDFARTLDVEQERFAMADVSMSATHPQHFQIESPGVTAETVVHRNGESQRVDGNSVDQDTELRKLAEAQLYYNATINALAKKMSMIHDVAVDPRI
jgi:flagellar basal-body rod protein FlgB